MITITKAIKDRHLFRPFLSNGDGDISSWQNWMIALRTLYGLPITKPHSIELIKQCTGRDASKLPKGGFSEVLFLTGRRSGKSRIAAIIGAYESSLTGKERLLSKGETPMVAILAPTKKQGRIVRNYLRAIFEQTPMLKNEVVNETSEGFLLSNGVLVEVLSGDWRHIRGYSILCCVVDELAYFGLVEESKVKSDGELIRAIRPSLSTTNGRLVSISSPYSRKGYCFHTHKKNFGNDNGKILVWNCPSRIMNKTLPQSIIDSAMQEDRQAALSEYMGEFRDDVSCYLTRELIEVCVKKGRRELLPNPDIKCYTAFCDLSGGKNESASVSVAHKHNGKVILDFIKEYKSPFNPNSVIEKMVEELKRYKVRRVIGDAYAGEFVASAFQRCGIKYVKADKSKSIIYLEAIPILCSQAVELLDNETLVVQYTNLQRRTRSGGADLIDHIAGCRDDICNTVSGSVVYANKKEKRIGVF